MKQYDIKELCRSYYEELKERGEDYIEMKLPDDLFESEGTE